MGSRLAIISVCLAALCATPAHAAVQPKPLMVGAAEDAAREGGPLGADAKMSLAALAGFDTIRLTSIWSPGQREVGGLELLCLQTAADAAALHGIRIVVSVYPFGARTTPVTAAARADFAAYAASIPRLVRSIRHVIVGNEPNLNRFWMPQFTPSGGNASAPAYLALLAQTYDAIKQAAPGTIVIGGSVSPRGADNPDSPRATHSPTAFIRDLGRAYRLSGRKRPVMDWLAFHPYLETSKLPPTFAHPRSTTISLADYGKLVTLLGKAFDGTAQRGSTLPILYDEFGVQTSAPADKRHLYGADVPAAVDAVDEATQARYYRQALQLAACQPNVVGLLFFHVSDESELDRWQSGVYYPDDTPKSSLPVVSQAALAARAGKLVTSCSR